MPTFITPVDITPGNTGWQDADVSSYVSGTAIGVIVKVNNGVTATDGGVRKNGSTDDRHGPPAGNSVWFMGIDSSKIVEVYGYTGLIYYLIGYFEPGEAYFFTNAVDKSLSSTGAWTDVDISGDTGSDTAYCAFLEHSTTGTNSFGYRKNGSSDARSTTNSQYGKHFGIAVGVDGSEIYESYVGSTDDDCFLTGYMKNSDAVSMNTNATDISLTTTGSWVDLTAIASGGNGGIVELKWGGTGTSETGIRKNGSSSTWTNNARHGFTCSECDGSQIMEGKIANTNMDFFLLGSFKPYSAPAAAGSLLVPRNPIQHMLVR